MELSRAELREFASFDDHGFLLQRVPHGIDASARAGIELGRYELPRRSGDAHLYRIHHPLASWVTEKAKARTLEGAKLVFDYDAYGTRVSTLEPYRGKAGWLTLKLIEVDALGNQEQHLLVTAITSDGITLLEDDPRELLRLPAVAQPPSLLSSSANSALSSDVEARKTELLREINQRNLGYFEQEVQKLDAWADDLKLGLEQEIKEIDRQIKEVRSTAATAPTLEEKLSWQKKQQELEGKRSKLRRDLFSPTGRSGSTAQRAHRPVGIAASTASGGAHAVHHRVGTEMMTKEISRGAIWRQWDLHVHTPASFHWSGDRFDVDLSSAKAEAGR